jgi:hypothetical protein
MKIKGESGSPCLDHRVGTKLPKGEPSSRMENENVEMHCLIHSIQVELNPSKEKEKKSK